MSEHKTYRVNKPKMGERFPEVVIPIRIDDIQSILIILKYNVRIDLINKHTDVHVSLFECGLRDSSVVLSELGVARLEQLKRFHSLEDVMRILESAGFEKGQDSWI